MNLNKVFIIGRMTVKPELKTTQSGYSVSSFGVATNRVWKDKAGAKQEETEFHNVVVWGRQAEVAVQFLDKGSIVMIEGLLRTRSWQDREGQQRKTTEIVCERLQLGPRPSGAGGGDRIGAQKPEGAREHVPEEIPTVDLDEEKTENLPF